MQKIHSFEANISTAIQNTPRILWKPKVRYRLPKSLQILYILSQIYPVNTLLSSTFKILFNIILPSTPGSSKRTLSLRPSHQNPVCMPSVSCTCHMPCQSHPPKLDHPDNVCWTVPTMDLLVTQVSFLNPLSLIASYQQIPSPAPYSQTACACVPPSVSETKFHTHTKKG